MKESSLSKSKSGLYFCSKEHQNEGYRTNLLSPGPKPQNITRTCIRCNKKRQSWYDICRKCELEITIEKWLNGDNSVTMNGGESKDTKKFVKKYLVETRGDACEVCGWNEKAPDGRSIIQMDHIDGNSQNNLINNLRLLCPNHHAMTSTYGNLNKGSGRAHRRKFA